jgi:tetratricopeptide (TPR) repeat protein
MAAILYESIKHIRFQALLAILVVIIGGTLLPNLFSIPIHLASRLQKSRGRSSISDTKPSESKGALAREELISTSLSRANTLAWTLVVAALFLLAAVRSYDFISNKYYLDAGDTTFFGAGESWWFPEKAMAFLEREHLPTNIFHDYNVGGYLTWRVGEIYPDFADGRFVPFAGDIFFQQKTLLSAPPDAPVWQEAAQRWNINTLIFSLSRYAGLGAYPLAAYCHSADWKPVYADDVSIIFLRNRPEYSVLLSRLTLDCDRFRLSLPPAAIGDSWRARAERFNFLMNSASTYYILSRDAEAFAALDEAASLSPDNSNLNLVKAQLLQANHRLTDAEQEYRQAIHLRPSDDAWFALATLYATQKRYSEAEPCLKQSISYSQIPYERLRSLGLLYVAMNQPQQALQAFDQAEAASPFHNDSSELARNFRQRLEEARAKASALGNTAK